MTEICWRVIHCRDNVESVYLVTAAHERQARSEVRWHGNLGHTCDMDCSWSAAPFQPDPPYFLYAINKTTGEMSLPTSTGARLCFVCMGDVPS